MFFTHNYTEDIHELFAEGKKYLSLQKKYIEMETADRLAVILSAVAIALVCILAVTVILLFASFSLAYWIGDLTGNMSIGFLCIAVALLLFLAIFYFNRKNWVIAPIARFMISLFVNKEEEENE